MRFSAGVLASLGLVFGPVAMGEVRAADELSFYAGIYGGASLLSDNTVEIIDYVGGPVGQTFYLDYAVGPAAGALVGVRLSDNVRAGLELAYRSGSLGVLTSPGNIITPGYSFDTSAAALLGEVFFDMPTESTITPYAGFGVGIARIWTSGSIAPGDPGFDYGVVAQTAPAAIVHLGATVPLQDGVKLFADYSYLHAFGVDAVISTAGYADKLGQDFGAHAVSVGLLAEF